MFFCGMGLLLIAIVALGSMFCNPLDELAEMDNGTLLKIYREMKAHVGDLRYPRPFDLSELAAEIKKRGLSLDN